MKLRFSFLIPIFGRPIRWDRSRHRFIAIFKDSGVHGGVSTGGYPHGRIPPRADTPRADTPTGADRRHRPKAFTISFAVLYQKLLVEKYYPQLLTC